MVPDMASIGKNKEIEKSVYFYAITSPDNRSGDMYAIQSGTRPRNYFLIFWAENKVIANKQ